MQKRNDDDDDGSRRCGNDCKLLLFSFIIQFLPGIFNFFSFFCSFIQFAYQIAIPNYIEIDTQPIW